MLLRELIGNNVWIIAEVGINHEGCLETCKKLIKAAADAGANAVKLQTIDPDLNYSSETESYQVFSNSKLTMSQTEQAFKFARKLGVEPFTTIGDINTLISDAKSYTPEDIEWDWYHGSISDMSTFKSGFALVVAITAAEMFSQGNWQRAWASEDEKSLKKGALLASLIVFPLIFIMGFLGASVAGQGAVADPSVSFFYLIEDIGIFFVVAFIILSVALVCSSADTLQNAIIASISRDICDDKIDLNIARYLTVAMIPLAIYLATGPTIAGFELDSGGVFEIFLRADLYAAATVGPVLLTLWDKVSSKGSLLGAFSGILSVIIYGTVTKDFSAGIEYLFSPTNEAGLANLEVFLSALLGSSFVTIVMSFILPDDE